MQEKVYKIRRKSDGLFSTGGVSPKFNSVGKVWKKKGHLSSHIAQAVSYFSTSVHARMKSAYADCEVVEYLIQETDIYPVTPIIDEKQEKYEEEKRKRDEQYREFRRQQLKKELEELEA